MSGDFKDSKMRAYPKRQQTAAFLILWALLVIVFPVSFYSHATAKVPAGMVFCPLSKRFQPVRLPGVKKTRKPFGDICAGAQTKELLFNELFLKNFSRTASLDENRLENLAFDVLAHGRPAFEKPPAPPQTPFENHAERDQAPFAARHQDEQKFIPKASPAAFSPSLAPRPPTAAATNLSSSPPLYLAADLSRRAAPRAPPSLFS